MSDTDNIFPHIPVQETDTSDYLEVIPQAECAQLPNLSAFAAEIKKSMAGVQVKLVRLTVGPFLRALRMKRGAGPTIGLVYFPNEVYVRGFISFCDLRKSRSFPSNTPDTLKPTFNVHFPRRSCSGKLARDDVSRYTVRANSIKKGVTNVKTKLPVYGTDMIFCVNGKDVSQEQEDSIGKLDRKVRLAIESLTGAKYGHVSAMFVKEITHLYKTQHNFIDPKYRQKVEEFLEVSQEIEEFRDHINKCFYMVTVTERLKQPWFTVTYIEGDNANTIQQCARKRKYHNLTTEFKTLPEMPDTLTDKMSVLSVMPTGEYIKKVGMKANDKVYFLYGGDAV